MGVNQERTEVVILKVLELSLQNPLHPFSRRKLELDAERRCCAALLRVAGGPFFFAATRRCSDLQVWA